MVRQATLAAIIAGCHETTARFLRHEATTDDSCLELFRRALVERNDGAWQALFTEYQGIVLGWVRQHAATRSLHDEDEFWMNRAFERFWTAITPERFLTFPTLAALLRYLKLCVHSVLLDAVRAQRARPINEDEVSGQAPDAATAVVDQLAGDDLWLVIEQLLHDEPERLVAYGAFVLDLKAAELQAQYPQHFATVNDVYRVKRNVLDRLRRNPELLQWQ